VVTLDDELAGREISFIKIDVEGYELATLRGALATLRRSRPVVLAEIEHAWSGASVAQPSSCWPGSATAPGRSTRASRVGARARGVVELRTARRDQRRGRRTAHVRTSSSNAVVRAPRRRADALFGEYSTPLSARPTTIVGVSAWIAWALIAVLLAIGEVLTPGLFFLVRSRWRRSPQRSPRRSARVVIELIVFVVGSGGAIGLLRPIARRHIRMPPRCAPGRRPLSGRARWWSSRSTLTAAESKIGGEIWSARAMDESRCSLRNQCARSDIEGATALVTNRT